MSVKVKREKLEPYVFSVRGEAESPFWGGIPKDAGALLEAPNKETKKMLLDAFGVALEQAVLEKDADAAFKIVEQARQKVYLEDYRSPLCCFHRDVSNGHCPVIGHYMVFAAFRDAAKMLYPEHFYEKKPGRTTKPSATHFRKFVKVCPMWIPFHKRGKLITKVAGIHTQQPTPGVNGFSSREFINPPFDFEFQIYIRPRGVFADLLDDEKKTVLCLKQAVNHGLGGGRAIGKGVWRIKNGKYGIAKDVEIQDDLAD